MSQCNLIFGCHLTVVSSQICKVSRFSRRCTYSFQLMLLRRHFELIGWMDISQIRACDESMSSCRAIVEYFNFVGSFSKVHFSVDATCLAKKKKKDSWIDFGLLMHKIDPIFDVFLFYLSLIRPFWRSWCSMNPNHHCQLIVWVRGRTHVYACFTWINTRNVKILFSPSISME